MNRRSRNQKVPLMFATPCSKLPAEFPLGPCIRNDLPQVKKEKLYIAAQAVDP